MIIVGNNIFVRLDGDTGVAAFSVVCYLMPIVFMVYDAVAMAAQPVQSYNYGTGDFGRVKKAFRVAIATGVCYAIGVVLLTTIFAPSVVYVFIDPADPANALAVEGLRLFSIGFVPMAVNIVVMSYFQSVERVIPATVISLLRGIVFMLACLLLMSHIWGNEGAWLAIPTSEILTMIVTLTMLACVKVEKKTAA
jgi:Na+-driven multidrug efflux pump